MITFKEWVRTTDEGFYQLWTVAISTRHSTAAYMGIYNSELEAFAAAMKEKQESGYAGYRCQAMVVPEKYKDDLIKYGVAGPGT
jgi:hypothetical protein